MAAEEYVVIRVKGPDKRVLGGAAGVGAVAPSVKDLSLETHKVGAGQIADLSQQPGVIAAKKMPVTLVKPFAVDVAAPAAAAVGATWGLEAVRALTSSRKGVGVTVAILDTGINAHHEAFQGKNIEQKDFTGEGDGDRNGHGTHCAGTVFGGTVGGKRIGVAPGVKKALIGKVLDKDGSGSTDQILDGLIWAARQGANVISMSLGLDFPGLVARLIAQGMVTEEATSVALEAYRQNVRLFDSVAALVRAHSAMFTKCIVVAAAGNESKRPQYEVAVAPPAAADGILSVGALGRSNASGSSFEVARFSNSGPAVSAPGVAIESAAHDNDGGLRTLSGTSMATPHVAGIAALWVEEVASDNPDFAIGDVEANLRARAVKNVFVDGVDPGNRGAGLVQAPQP